MTYIKPEVQKLGDAADVIQILLTKGPATSIDPSDHRHFNPAYDLDE
ncbi:MAG TPA: hypothetical protein VJV96_08400 [Candidatus Angelobacter sp.]|nr:hypothetical protein [Candidatus Angelobacter sp.]